MAPRQTGQWWLWAVWVSFTLQDRGPAHRGAVCLAETLFTTGLWHQTDLSLNSNPVTCYRLWMKGLISLCYSHLICAVKIIHLWTQLWRGLNEQHKWSIMVLRHYLLGVISALLPPLIFTASDVCILIPWKRNSKLQETNHITLVGMLFLKRKFLKNYSIVALHCCVMFWCTIKWISYMYTYNLSCLDFLSI